MGISARLSGGTVLTAQLRTPKDLKPKLVSVSLLSSKWEGNESPFSQVVSIEGVTATSKVDLTPSVEQLDIFHEKDVAFTTENDGGVVTVFAVGDRPTNDYTIQAIVTEVAVE